MAKYARKTTEEKQEELKAIHSAIQGKVDAYVTNPLDMIDFIRFSKNFYRYSFRNQLLIHQQKDHASYIASFTDWKKKGYSVNKGEKALKIFQPVTKTVFKDEKGEWLDMKYASPEQQKGIQSRTLPTKSEYIGSKIASVFDISQTNVPVEDYPTLAKQHFVSEKTESYEHHIQGAMLFTQEKGIGVTSQNLGVHVGGYYAPDKHDITLSSHLENEKLFGTFVHEIVHSQMHREDDSLHEEREIQAETASAIVLKYYGIEPSEYNLRYLQSYGEGMTEEQKYGLVEETFKVCHNICQKIDYYLEHREAFQELRKEYDLSEEKYNHAFIKELHEMNKDQQKEYMSNLLENSSLPSKRYTRETELERGM